ncbi:VIT domain-containing protein [Luteolibacter flavescens]|uniref:VIT domain-containing protein n=1 Tax=Luteolibacter flavescens TaxID=1859460 RepID=A0ABT3FQE0_9BACT|nr:VIT domain-containing protein [Luteolibacter flavescens]MCW1885667.1 VIT domain-containing protein [Luteolibacter flavescens]
MKRILGILCCWFSACLVLQAQIQGPRMTVAGTQTILEIEEAAVDIRVTGGVARTEMELVFRNDTDRMVEGEFTLPLPEGATVSSYALEVNGALREAVAVEKERASRAYETIKRQMIDPGIVERQAGNVYRTRVFPVPAKGTKRLRIGYVENLPRGADSYRYRVPLRFAGLLKEFRAGVAVADDAGLKLTGTTPVSFVADGKGKRLAKASAVRLDGEMEITVPFSAGPELLVEGKDDPVFLLGDVFPDLPDEARVPAHAVSLFWDASESCARRDPVAMFRLLDQWFLAQGEVKVAVKLLRNDVEDAGVHEVRGGDWSAIRRLLESVDYDGASSLAGIESGDSDLVLYCGDGEVTWGGATTGLLKSPLLVLHRGAGPLAPALAERAEATGGAVVNADAEDTATALRKLRMLPLRVTGVSGNGVKDFQVAAGDMTPGAPVRISGRLTTSASILEISYGVGKETRVRRQMAVPVALPDEGLLRRLWAQGVLAELEKGGDRSAIIDHCRKHGLVSDETSLIVLERFQDHITYEIPPPEPDLKERYDLELAKRRGAEVRSLIFEWKARVAWHRQSFPWREVGLLPRIRRIGIWKDSVGKVFQADEIDAASFATVTGWRDRALALIERKDALTDAAAYREWVGQVDALFEEGKGIPKTPVAPPAAGKPLVVSVRGLVVRPGQVKSAGKLTLLDSVAQAGGPLWDGGMLGRVALYRNSGKTVYNTYSKRFEDIELRPGDMVVVEGDPYAYGGSDDPFFDAPAHDPAADDPVVEEPGDLAGESLSTLGSGSGDPFGAGNSSGGSPVVMMPAHPSDGGMADLAAFEEKLKAGADPYRAYLEAKDGKQRVPMFYSEAARRLFAAGHEALALRVISTLSERDRGRAAAFWLMEFGQPEAAARLLRELPEMERSLPVGYALAETAASEREAANCFGGVVGVNNLLSGSVIALTDLNRLDDGGIPEFEGNLTCDLRIVVQSEFPGIVPELQVLHPGGKLESTWAPSPIGGRLTSGPGIAEFAIRRAVPGRYQVRVLSENGTTYRIAIYKDWGRDSQKTERITKWVGPGEQEVVSDLEFEFRPASEK